MSSSVNTALIPGKLRWKSSLSHLTDTDVTDQGFGHFFCKLSGHLYYGTRNRPIQVYRHKITGYADEKPFETGCQKRHLAHPRAEPPHFVPPLTPVLLFPLDPPLSIGTCGDIMTRSLSALSARGAPYKCETQPSLRCGAFLRAFVQRHSSHKTPPGPSEALLSKP